MAESNPIAAHWREAAYSSRQVWTIQMWDDMNNALYRQAQEIERLREGLLAHACMCGPTDPDPSVHREDCPYRKWSSPPQRGEQP